MGIFGRKQEHGTWRPLHQRECPEYQPEPQPAFGGLRVSAWIDRQLRAMQPRETGAQTALPATRAQETGEQLALPAPTRSPATIRHIEDIPTARQLPGLPPYLVARFPLPVKRAEPLTPVPADDLHITDLPTWIGTDGVNKQVAEILAKSEPLQDDSWLTAPPPTLRPMATGDLASSDKVANPLGVTPADEQIGDDGPPTEMTERAKANKSFNQAISGLLGSEESND